MNQQNSLLNLLIEVPHAFPKLVLDVNFGIKSKTDDRYNCIAWAIVRDDVWVDALEGEFDGIYWPASVPKGRALTHLEAMFSSYGYVRCDDSFEEGYMKVALFEKQERWSHAARQLPGGNWASKMGQLEDIHHNTPFDIEGDGYGKVGLFMKRANSSYKKPKPKK